jgi:hypothetical protein
MTEKPIIFSAEMVRAILDNRKMMTRRVVKPQPILEPDGRWSWKDKVCGPEAYIGSLIDCPYSVGMRLWVRESFLIETNYDLEPCEPPFKDGRPVKWYDDEQYGRYWEQAHYAATDPMPQLVNEDCPYQKCADNGYCQHWKPSIYMPRWASRITLEITGVRVERVQEIGYEAIGKEGIPLDPGDLSIAAPIAVDRFERLWDSINAKRGFGWDKNPWVRVLEFKRI